MTLAEYNAQGSIKRAQNNLGSCYWASPLIGSSLAAITGRAAFIDRGRRKSLAAFYAPAPRDDGRQHEGELVERPGFRSATRVFEENQERA
jgi:hypothetical protein